MAEASAFLSGMTFVWMTYVAWELRRRDLSSDR